jgi:hypothetical protein
MARVHNCGNTSCYSWDVIGGVGVDGLGAYRKWLGALQAAVQIVAGVQEWKRGLPR